MNILRNIKTFLTNIFLAIKISFFKSLKGKESFWVVFFGWGVLFYCVSVLIMFCMIFPLTEGIKGFIKFNHLDIVLKSFVFVAIIIDYILKILLGIFGFMMIFLYPIIFSLILIKNIKKKDLYLIIFFLLLLISFIFLHVFLFAKLLTFISNLLISYIFVLPYIFSIY